VAAVKRSLRIPVVANGDIDSPQKARAVFAATGADAIMIGRAAQGRPWIFREIAHFLETGEKRAAASRRRQGLADRSPRRPLWLHGEFAGVRSARKHIGWTLRGLPGGDEFRSEMNTIDSCEAQIKAVADWFDALADRAPLMPAATRATAHAIH
jgi:tRNA-dihydrouridine synthase B